MRRKRILAVLCVMFLLAIPICMAGCGAKKEESVPKKQEEKEEERGRGGGRKMEQNHMAWRSHR